MKQREYIKKVILVFERDMENTVKMRDFTKSFQQIEFCEEDSFSFSEEMLPGGMILEDLDQDGESELIVGSTQGNLYVYKRGKREPVLVERNLGSIAFVLCGKLYEDAPKKVHLLFSLLYLIVLPKYSF